MNYDIIAGNWKQLRGAMTTRWGCWTGDSFTVFVGEQDSVNGRIQERLGRLRVSSRRSRNRLRLVGR